MTDRLDLDAVEARAKRREAYPGYEVDADTLAHHDVPALLALVREARDLIAALEWEGCDRDAMPACPMCRADAPDYEKRGRPDEYERHRDGCTLRAWLSRLTESADRT